MRLKKKFDIDYDPVNPRADFHNLTDEEKHKILVECKKNPIYFMRECVKTTEVPLSSSILGI